jgi:two-component system sensor histidine kinase KdpD
LWPALAAMLLVGLVTVGLLLCDAFLPLSLVPLAYLIPVVIAATRWGLWPAILASLAGAATADVLFFPPYYSLRIDNPQDLADLLLFLFVAIVSSNLAARVRHEADMLRQREQHIQDLYEFSHRLALCFTVRDLVAAIHGYVAMTLDRRAAFIAATEDENLDSLDEAAVPESVRRQAVAMIASADRQTRRSFDGTRQALWLLKAVSSESVVHGVIAVEIGSSSGDDVAQTTRRIESVVEEAAVTLERIDVGKAMNEARLRLQADMLKDAMHGLISHELRTPLTSILGAASVLGATRSVLDDGNARSLVDGIHDEANRLDAFLKNLIDASRVTADGVRSRLEWVDPADMVNAAIERRTARLQRHRIARDFDNDLPLVRADSILIEEACGQLLDNAAKYSPAGSTITVTLHAEHDHVALSVIDEGFGVTTEEQRHMGRKSFRGHRHVGAIAGFGLGLWIATAFVKANGGTLGIRSRDPDAGTIATITLPIQRRAAPELTTAAHE